MTRPSLFSEIITWHSSYLFKNLTAYQHNSGGLSSFDQKGEPLKLSFRPSKPLSSIELRLFNFLVLSTNTLFFPKQLIIREILHKFLQNNQTRQFKRQAFNTISKKHITQGRKYPASRVYPSKKMISISTKQLAHKNEKNLIKLTYNSLFMF